MSGNSVTTTPDEKETNNMIQKTGKTFGSKTSFQPILNKLHDKGLFIALGKVSFIRSKIKIENNANKEDIQNISFKPISDAK